jgi:hypothetical protein
MYNFALSSITFNFYSKEFNNASKANNNCINLSGGKIIKRRNQINKNHINI